MNSRKTLPTPLQYILTENWFWFIMASLFTIITYGHQWLGLPHPQAIATYLKDLYQHYGIIIVALGVFIEGLFMVGFYFPGSFILVMAVVFSTKTLPALATIASIAIAITLLNSIINYYLGAKGFYHLLSGLGGQRLIKNMRVKLNTNLTRTLYFTAWHPNVLALAMIGCGISQLGLTRTLSQIWLPISLWIIAWVTIFTLFIPIEQLAGDGNPLGLVLAFWGFIVFKCAQSYRQFKSGKIDD